MRGIGPSEEYLAHRRRERDSRRASWLVKGIYKVTPSPPASEIHQNDSEDDSMLTEDEEELEQELAKLQKKERKERKRTKEREAADALFAKDAPLQALYGEELALLRAYLDMVELHVAQEEAERKKKEEEDAMVGPEPLYTYDDGKSGADGAHSLAGHYGTHLLPGEGSAMAAYVASGQRIPRRGEVGLDASEIERFETAGYVMSGNRHAKMNAIRERKENQVYTAEEKAAMAMLAFEEKKQKEQKIVEDLKKMVEGAINEANK